MAWTLLRARISAGKEIRSGVNRGHNNWMEIGNITFLLFKKKTVTGEKLSKYKREVKILIPTPYAPTCTFIAWTEPMISKASYEVYPGKKCKTKQVCSEEFGFSVQSSCFSQGRDRVCRDWETGHKLFSCSPRDSLPAGNGRGNYPSFHTSGRAGKSSVWDLASFSQMGLKTQPLPQQKLEHGTSH